MDQSLLTKFNLDSSSVSVPNFIAIEGPIGVGKTTLTKKLASSLNYEVILEEPDTNPFLEAIQEIKAYRDHQIDRKVPVEECLGKHWQTAH